MSYNNFSDGYKKALINAENNIKEIGFKELNIEDVFLEIVKNSNGGVKEIFSLYGINEKLTIEIMNKSLFNENPDTRKGVYSGMNTRLKNLILGSVKIAASFSKNKASLEDFLISMLKNDSWFVSFLDYIGIVPSDIEKNLLELNRFGAVDGQKSEAVSPGELPKTGDESIDNLLGALTNGLFGEQAGMENAGMEGDFAATPFDGNKKQEGKKEDSTTPALDFFSTDLTKEAHEGKIDSILGRDTEIERLIAILNRKTKNNPALVGEPGVGKTAIAEGLALRISQGSVPFSMKIKESYLLICLHLLLEQNIEVNLNLELNK